MHDKFIRHLRKKKSKYEIREIIMHPCPKHFRCDRKFQIGKKKKDKKKKEKLWLSLHIEM